MFSSRSGMTGFGQLALAALALIGWPLFDCGAARADLVPCTILICGIQNPLTVTSGSVQAYTTDGEAVVRIRTASHGR